MLKTSNREIFFNSVKAIIGSEQPILSAIVKATPELPGHIMCVYTDTVTLKSKFESIEKKVFEEAEKLDLEIAFDLPIRYNGQLPEEINREQRFLSVAVYDKQELKEPIVVNI